LPFDPPCKITDHSHNYFPPPPTITEGIAIHWSQEQGWCWSPYQEGKASQVRSGEVPNPQAEKSDYARGGIIFQV